MIPIVCIDGRDGLRFHDRRQSRDRAVTADVMRMAQGQPVWMDAASAVLFPAEAVRTEARFLAQAPEGAYCFVEGAPLSPWLSRIEEVVVYGWNRIYPADMWLDLNLMEPEWRLVSREEFPGYSHARITKERYRPIWTQS